MVAGFQKMADASTTRPIKAPPRPSALMSRPSRLTPLAYTLVTGSADNMMKAIPRRLGRFVVRLDIPFPFFCENEHLLETLLSFMFLY